MSKSNPADKRVHHQSSTVGQRGRLGGIEGGSTGGEDTPCTSLHTCGSAEVLPPVGRWARGLVSHVMAIPVSHPSYQGDKAAVRVAGTWPDGRGLQGLGPCAEGDSSWVTPRL